MCWIRSAVRSQTATASGSAAPRASTSIPTPSGSSRGSRTNPDIRPMAVSELCLATRLDAALHTVEQDLERGHPLSYLFHRNVGDGRIDCVHLLVEDDLDGATVDA